MKVNVHGFEVECPDKPHMLKLVQSVGPMQAWTLAELQKQLKNWPNHGNIPTYCIYMGSDEVLSENKPPEKVDFYHYEDGPDNRYYSTAIVFGDGPGDYRSGWQELAAKSDVYREHLRREFRCGFLSVDDLVKVGMAALGVDKAGSDTIRPMRTNFRLGEEPDGVVDARRSGWLADEGWCVWFLTVWTLFLMALLPGSAAVSWFLLGSRGVDVWCAGAVGLVATVVCGWWITRGRKYCKGGKR